MSSTVTEAAPLDIFSPDQVCRLARITRRQLGYWEKTNFFGSEPYPGERYYGFRDVVALRAIGTMRNLHHVSLGQLRRVGEWLHDDQADWWSTTFYVGGRNVYWIDRRTGARIGLKPRDQIEMPVAMTEVRAEVIDAIRDQRQRRPEEIGQIVRRRGVAGNAPVVAGTRIPVAAILSFHDAGYSPEQIRRQYPDLTDRDIEQAIAWETERKVS